MRTGHRLSLCVAMLLLAAVPAGAKKAKGPVPVGEPFAIGSCADCREGAPFVAGSADGRFFALWSTTDLRLRGRVFDLAGEPGPVLVLAEDREARIGGVAAGADGDFRVAWLWPDQVHVQRFGLSSAGSPVLVTSGPGGADDDNARLAARPDGSLVLVWGRTFAVDQPAEVRAQLLSADATPLAPAVVLDTPFGRGTPEVCGLSDGGAAVAWARQPGASVPGQPPSTGLAVRRLSAGGSPDDATLLPAPPGTPTWSLGHTVACGADGSFALAWHTRDSPARSGSDVVVHLVRSGGSGGTVSIVPLGAKGDQSDPALLYEPGRGWLVAWSSFDKGKSEIRGRRLSPSGRLLGRDFVLHGAAKGRRADYPALARVGELFVLTWVEDGRARGRLFKP